MTAQALIESLRSIAETLRPFIQETVPGTRQWDGSRYAETAPKTADLEARVWWSVLTTMAEMLDGQGGPVKPRQLSYIREELFGGMGSFAEFALDESGSGDPDQVRSARQRLREQTDGLLRVIEDLEAAR